jgi:hypothetical protein
MKTVKYMHLHIYIQDAEIYGIIRTELEHQGGTY